MQRLVEPYFRRRIDVPEPENSAERYADSVLKDDSIVEHLPKKISKVSSIFIARGGSIMCKVTERRRYSSDLPQGGSEVPCEIHFTGQKREVSKLKL